ncbi:LacI family DNA-binding transcriptional regulator [Shouchella shacheensis]|uniref:LacI family DNA-binding transcriptional regulator n=1 Tax=Shouchella shacheensis TaxID=1649580 RepID=UPI00073FCE7B|nr:LacI family DNA-binding transcriptional regulator [Shouchella shacheensis]
MATIADIARLASVAKSTVSRYLNGGSVGKDTARKIERVIQETGYAPNKFAQSLKAKRTAMIGTVIPRLDSFATTQTLIGIDQQLRELDYQLFVSNTSQDVERELENIHVLAKQKVDGIILIATVVTEKHVDVLNDIQVPVLLVGQEHTQFHSFTHDDYHAAYDMGKYVCRMGHTRIAYLGVTEDDIAVGVMRKKGFKQALSEVEGVEARYFETSFKSLEAVPVTMDILESYQPSIFVCATDNIALGVLKASHKKGLRVPKDVSITGFGGYEVTDLIHPGITTAKFFYREAGEMAAKQMVNLVNGQEVPRRMRSAYELIEKESVDKR